MKQPHIQLDESLNVRYAIPCPATPGAPSASRRT